MEEASAITTLRDLGIPTILGALLGALMTHFAAKARGREEHKRTLDLLIRQDERRAAQTALDVARDIRNRFFIDGQIPDYSALHETWLERILPQTRLIRCDELARRVQVGLDVILYAGLAPNDRYVTEVVRRGFLDLEEWLEAWLRGESPPAARLPPSDQIYEMVRPDGEGGRISFERLSDHFAAILLAEHTEKRERDERDRRGR